MKRYKVISTTIHGNQMDSINNSSKSIVCYNRLNSLISIEFICMCGGYFLSSALIGSQRFVVYPLLILSIIANYLLSRRVSNAAPKRDISVVFLFTLVLLLSCSIAIIAQQRVGLEETIAQLVLIVLGVVYSFQVVRWLRFSFILYIGYILILVGLFAYALNVPQEMIRGTLFPNVSANAVSAQLLWISGFISIGVLKQDRACLPTLIKYLHLLLTLALCIYVGGRAGMIISIIQLIGMFLALNKPSELSLGRTIIVILSIVIVFTVAVNIERFSDLAIYKNFELSGFSSDGRSGILSEYLDSLGNPLHFLFGTDLGSLETISFYKQPHNSYVLLHSYTGILGFLLVCISLVVGIYRISGGNLGLMLVVSSFPIRVFFDSVCFFSNIDFCIYVICISAFCSRPIFETKGLIHE